MVGSTASIRQVEVALRDPQVAAIEAAHSVVLAVVVMSYPVGEEAIMKGLCRFPNSCRSCLGKCQGRRHRNDSYPLWP